MVSFAHVSVTAEYVKPNVAEKGENLPMTELSSKC